jgi:hypothetical protein
MLFDDQEVTSIAELVRALETTNGENSPRWYRGQSDFDWQLVPSLGRPPSVPAHEDALIKRFKQNALSYIQRVPSNEWEWLFLMQHHRVPTRLLDWSENPLVALYFAVTENLDRNACLWCLDPVQLNKASHIQTAIATDIPCFSVDEDLDQYLPREVLSGMYKKPPVAALAMRYFPRLTAQSGVFTITHRELTPIEIVGDGAFVGRLKIPSAAKKNIARELRLLGITRLALFPDLDSVAEHAREVTQ